jgi:hypothetical protein
MDCLMERQMFDVRVCIDGNPGLGRTIRSYRYYTAAKRHAERDANDHHWGLVVHDTARGIVDWGNGWTSDRDCEANVDAPRYARKG